MRVQRLVAIFLFLISLSASAQDQLVELGQPTFSGTGCSDQEDMVTISPDSSTISVLFNKFSARAGGYNRQIYSDRKSCDLKIPVKVAPGYSVAIVHFDYRGFMSVKNGTQGSFSVKYQFGGQNPISRSQLFTNYDSDFLISNDLIGQEMLWSPCGKASDLKIQTAISVRTNYSYDIVEANMDSLDLNSASMSYRLIFRSCN